MKKSLTLRLAPVVFTVGFFVIWEIACRVLKISSFLVPTPTAVFGAMVQYQWPLLRGAGYTLWMTLLGFGLSILFSVIIGLIIGSSRFLYAGLNPLLVGFNSIPKVAVVPLLVIWFGVGWLPPVLTAFII
jgi:NitT/TauT family transport system permease protein